MSQNCLVLRRDSYARQSVPETIRETAVPRTAECEKGAADRAVTDHGDLTVEIRNRWTENLPDENVYHRWQGYLPKLVTKINEMPATFESSVVK